MNNRYALIALIALVVAASGCASQTDKGELPTKTDGNVEKKIDVEDVGTIRRVDVDTGTCYVYDWGNGGGISCITSR